MSGGLLALLDDMAALAKVSASSLDDLAAATGKATAKAAGIVVDDAAMTPGFVSGVRPADELRLVWRITLGSLRNKLLFLLPAALALGAFAPWAVMPLLSLGGAYLCFEAAEKVRHAFWPGHGERAPEPASVDARAQGAIRTDFILSAEIMSITLQSVSDKPSWEQGLVLASVGLLMTLLVYGVVALIVKADDAGLALLRGRSAALRAVGRGLLAAVPFVLQVLSVVGTGAMAWVGGGIILHGLASQGWAAPEHLVKGWAALAGPAAPVAEPVLAGVFGLAIGAALLPLGSLVARIRRAPPA